MISAPAPQPLTGTKIAPFSVLMNIQLKNFGDLTDGLIQ